MLELVLYHIFLPYKAKSEKGLSRPPYPPPVALKEYTKDLRALLPI